MRRRFFALGYVFFALLTVTGLVMVFSFIERITTKPILTKSDLIEEALTDTASIAADPAYVIENIGKDLHASLANFHYYPDLSFIEQSHRSNCLSCHTPLPHNKEIKSRAFLNMHGNFIACQTCHGSKSAPEYQWYDVERSVVAETLLADIPLMSIQLIGVEKGAFEYVKASDPAFLGEYTAEIKSDPVKQDLLCKDNYRNDLTKAMTCENCHTSQAAVIDWSILGYSEERILELETLSTPAVFEKYDEFFIPSF